MKKSYLIILLTTIAATLFLSCDTESKPIQKLGSKDQYKESMVSSQFFEINTEKDTILEGEEGTMLVFPTGALIDSQGSPVQGTVTIELAEALSLSDMLASNLTTTSKGQPLETDGMIFFNATRKRKQLLINPENPIRIEIPTTKRKPGMMVYQGIRDESGNMDWINPKKIESRLIPIAINSLDFLPKGFAEEVEKGMPFKNHEKATFALIDSLYYSFSFLDIIPESVPETVSKIDINESYYDSIKQNYLGAEIDSLLADSNEYGRAYGDSIIFEYGVDPAIIKTIRSDKFENTLIATREFEERLQLMFKICRTDITDIYLKNLDKNLYELDSLTAVLLQGNRYQKAFQSFSEQRLTTVEGPSVNTKQLKQYYEERLKKIKKELTVLKNKAIEAENKKDEEAQKILDQYKNLLNRREKYRMETYGFEMTETGWINIDIGIEPKDWEYQNLTVNITNAEDYKNIHTYIVYTSIKSLYRLNTKDETTFYVGNQNRREMIMPKNEKAVIVALSFKEKQPSIAVKEFTTNTVQELNLQLTNTSEEKFNTILEVYHDYGSENRIEEDLAFLKKLNKEQLRQEELKKEWAYLSKLRSVAFPIDSTFMYFNSDFQIDMKVCTPYEDFSGIQEQE